MKYREIKEFSRQLRKNATHSEKVLWERIKDRKIDGYKFLRQHPIMYDRQGNDLRFFIPDFYCPAAKLVIELDGPAHELNREYDSWRNEILREKNLKVMRFRNSELRDLDIVLRKIRIAISESEARQFPPPSREEG